MATTKTETQLYSFLRKAFAPFWISIIRKTMRSLPGSAAFTFLKKNPASSRPRRADAAARYGMASKELSPRSGGT